MKTCKKERNLRKLIAKHNRKAARIISELKELKSYYNGHTQINIPVISEIYFNYNFGNKKEIIFSNDICHRFQLDYDGDILTLTIPPHIPVINAINKVLKGQI